jgi:hypothetical protein
MQLIQTQHRAGLVGLAATTALCSLAIRHTLADPQQREPALVQVTSSETLPFDPPVVYPGFGSDMGVFKREPLRSQAGPSFPRNLLFRDEDRKSFKALHPFLLTRPQAYSAQDGQQGTVTYPGARPRRL